MIKVVHLGDDGTEMATIEVDDFTIEVIYSGIAEMLREAAVSAIAPTASGDLIPEARQRRQRILSRIRD